MKDIKEIEVGDKFTISVSSKYFKEQAYYKGKLRVFTVTEILEDMDIYGKSEEGYENVYEYKDIHLLEERVYDRRVLRFMSNRKQNERN